MALRVFGYELVRRAPVASLSPVPRAGGWWPIIREPYTGAWQKNDEVTGRTALSYAAVFSCTTLIASDIGKLRLRLVEQDAEGIWSEVSVPAFSPVLRKPNRYQIINKFIEQWIVSKLSHGNAYILKQRDGSGLVKAMYVLDPQKVTPLVAPDGSVFYQLKSDDLTGVPASDDWPGGLPVPASEIIHDPMVPLFHPLIGVTPIYACGLVAMQGLKIVDNSTAFFSTGSSPGGILTAPGVITKETAERLSVYFNENFTGANVGKVAVVGDGLKYEPMTVNATDAQLIEQLKWTTETIAGCYHVPAALIDSSHQPPYANSEPLVQQYFSQCLQALIVSLELHLDEGLGLTTSPGHTYGTEFDIDDLLWMDTKNKTDAATGGVTGGVLTPNEARAKYFGLGSVAGGSSPYMQQQMFSLEALSKRDATDPFTKTQAPAALPADDDDEDFSDFDMNAFTHSLAQKEWQ